MLKAIKWVVHKYSADNTGAYSPYKRLRLRASVDTEPSTTKEERASVFPEF